MIDLPVETLNQPTGRATSSPDLAIVIPAIDERENLELLIPALWDVLKSVGVSAEISLVDGRSKDGTGLAAENRGARVVRQTERGYGGALLAGFAATRAAFIVTMDADLSHRPSFIVEMWKNRSNAHVLIGSRYVPGGEAEMTLSRRILSKALNTTYARVLSLPLKDLSSGFRMYREDHQSPRRLSCCPPDCADRDVLCLPPCSLLAQSRQKSLAWLAENCVGPFDFRFSFSHVRPRLSCAVICGPKIVIVLVIP